MILPSKHIPEDQALIGVGATVLKHLGSPQTITSLWESVRNEKNVGTYERFVLALDFLHIMGVVGLNKGMIKRVAE